MTSSTTDKPMRGRPKGSGEGRTGRAGWRTKPVIKATAEALAAADGIAVSQLLDRLVLAEQDRRARDTGKT